MKDWNEEVYTDANLGHDDHLEISLAHVTTVNFFSKFKKTPLMAAARAGREACVHLLLSNGAKVIMRDPSGNSALTWAMCGVATLNHKEATLNIIKTLRQHGAKLDPTSKADQDAANYFKHQVSDAQYKEYCPEFVVSTQPPVEHAGIFSGPRAWLSSFPIFGGAPNNNSTGTPSLVEMVGLSKVKAE